MQKFNLPVFKGDKVLDSVRIKDANQKVNWLRIANSRPVNPIWLRLAQICVMSFVVGGFVDVPYIHNTLKSKNVWDRLFKT